MTDERLRTLERTWRESGSPKDEAAWLRARLRAGDDCGRCYEFPPWLMESCQCYVAAGCPVDFRPQKQPCACSGTPEQEAWVCPHCADLDLRERIELAAYCGDEAARLVVGWCCRLHAKYENARNLAPCVTGETKLHNWLSGLSRWGREVQVRAAVAVAREALPLWEAANYSDWCRQCGSKEPRTTARGCRGCEDASRPRVAIEAAEAWLEDPSDANRKIVWKPFGPHNPPATLGVPFGAMVVLVAGESPWQSSAECYWGAVRRSGLPDTQVRTTISTALIPWALGNQ